MKIFPSLITALLPYAIYLTSTYPATQHMDFQYVRAYDKNGRRLFTRAVVTGERARVLNRRTVDLDSL